MPATAFAACAWCVPGAIPPGPVCCECRADCGSPFCLPVVPACEVAVGMTVFNPAATGLDATAGTLDDPWDALEIWDVRSVTVLTDGRVTITSPAGETTVPADWPVASASPADIGFAALLRHPGTEAA